MQDDSVLSCKPSNSSDGKKYILLYAGGKKAGLQKMKEMWKEALSISTPEIWKNCVHDCEPLIEEDFNKYVPFDF